ncbi:hypothetical protein [Micavibrio aeruginosavorus]|uniref:hypothetical protein n=1 Tax=Micavibrio aeruginosavorus TaxID=349221 RepID=UPI003F4AB952
MTFSRASAYFCFVAFCVAALSSAPAKAESGPRHHGGTAQQKNNASSSDTEKFNKHRHRQSRDKTPHDQKQAERSSVKDDTKEDRTNFYVDGKIVGYFEGGTLYGADGIKVQSAKTGR